MKLSEQQIEKIQEAKRQFLWKVKIFEMGFNYQKEEKISIEERMKLTVEYSFHLETGVIFDKKIEDLDEKEFVYQLGKYIQSISTVVSALFSSVIYPLDSLIEDYENEIKEILL